MLGRSPASIAEEKKNNEFISKLVMEAGSEMGYTWQVVLSGAAAAAAVHPTIRSRHCSL